MSPWTEDKVERLKQLFLAGRSCSQIGSELGVTRNAVIGKVHRLNLSSIHRLNPDGPKAKPHRREQRRVRVKPPPHALKAHPVKVTTRVLEASNPVGLTQLTSTTCRWPLWGPEASGGLYCGGHCDPQSSRPYCDAHERINTRRST